MSKKNLFVCLTPFQIYFSMKIIESKNIENALILLIDLSNSSKNYYYLERARLQCKCEVLAYKEVNNKKILKLFGFLRFILSNFFLKKFNSIYMASLHDKYIHILMKFISFDKIIGFDDGVANLNKNGAYFNDEYIKRNIINKMDKHYTVFLDVENIVGKEKIEVLNIFNGVYGASHIKNSVKFFVGQPIDELFKSKGEDYLSSIIKSLGVDFYFKHPREKYVINGVAYVDSHEIFESYLERFLVDNPNTEVLIYTFISTVVFNVSNFSNVKLFSLYDDELYAKYKSLYDLAEDFNIEMKSLNEIS
ncbi:glycosyltransferase family 52 [Acinetobacter baumannii]|uniref:glycosyltransferase family 52 n=1 Tax=Acinetobacter baumannii TaxID=470 RepID=UPI003A8823B9